MRKNTVQRVEGPGAANLCNGPEKNEERRKNAGPERKTMNTTEQILLISGCVILGLAAIATLIMLPELRRYYRIRRM